MKTGCGALTISGYERNVSYNTYKVFFAWLVIELIIQNVIFVLIQHDEKIFQLHIYFCIIEIKICYLLGFQIRYEWLTHHKPT